MTARMKTVCTVHFQARVRHEMFDRIAGSVLAAGVPLSVLWDVAKRNMLHAARCAATSMAIEMANWTPEQWAEQEEVREYKRTHPTEEG